MNILLIAHFFPPTHNAGAEKRALGYALALQNLGHRVQVVCAGEWNRGEQHMNGFTDEVYQGIPVRRVHFNWTKASDPNRSLYANPRMEEQLDAWIEQWQPDVVHIISMLTLSASVVRSAKKRGLPVVFTLTDFWLICPKISLVRGDGSLCDGITSSWDCLKCLLWNSKAYRILRRALPEGAVSAALTRASRAPAVSRLRGLRGMALDMDERKRVMAETARQIDCFTAPSTFLAKTIEASGILPRPVRVIHSGHDLAWAERLPPKTGSDALRIGYIGQVIAVKGLHLLIPAFQAAVKDAGRPAKLLIYGSAPDDSPYAARLKAMLRPGDEVHFLGAFPHSRLGEVLVGIDVLVVPSQWHENNPRVIQEAFAARTPVIASNVGGISEFIRHGVDGLLFAHDSAGDLGAQMRRLIADPEMIERLRAGIRPVKTIQEEIKEILCIYQELTARPEPAEAAGQRQG